jgi:PKD repeat protein
MRRSSVLPLRHHRFILTTLLAGMLTLLLLPAAQAQYWETPALIENFHGYSGSPELRTDSHGNTLAVWQQFIGTGYIIYSNRHVAGQGWGDPVLVDNPNGYSYPPGLAMDGNGRAIAVWKKQIGTDSSLLINRFDPDSGWGLPESLHQSQGYVYDYVKVAMDAEGNAFVVWLESAGNRRDCNVYAIRYDAGTGQWGTPTLLENSPGSVNNLYRANPEISMDENGNAMAVWYQNEGTYSYFNIYASRYEAGIGWQTPVLLETQAGNALAPSLLMEENGVATVMWDQWDGSYFSVYATRYVPGSGWGPVREFKNDSPVNFPYSPPIMALDPLTGDVIAVWDMASYLYSSRFVEESGWTEPVQIEAVPPGSYTGSIYPDIATDRNGNATVVWEQQVEWTFHVYAVRYEPESGWASPVLIDNGTRGAYVPHITALVNGNMLATWYQNQPSPNNFPGVYSSQFIAGSLNRAPIMDPIGFKSVGENALLAFKVNAFDPDGDALTYTASGLPAGASFNPATRVFSWVPTYDQAGLYTASFNVSDGALSDSETVPITVLPVNRPPVAMAGRDQSLECTGNGCASVTLDGSLSFDPDGDSMNYTWTGPFGTATGMKPVVSIPVGTHTVTLTVSDGRLSANDTVMVNVRDTAPPDIAGAAAAPPVLRPPNHRMIPVTVSVSVSDLCDESVTCRIVSVVSNEPENGLGDGNTAPDWEITGDLTVNLRAERSGKGSGRIYTITVQCADSSGNTSTRIVTVAVPHNGKG